MMDGGIAALDAEQTQRLMYYRFLATALACGSFVFALIECESIYFKIGYTQWGLIMTLVTFIMLTISSVVGSDRLEYIAGKLFVVAWSSECVITVFFWLILFVAAIVTNQLTDDVSTIVYNIQVHSLPMVLLFVEQRLDNIVFAKLDLLFTFIPFVPYSIISMIYAYEWDTTMYSVMNWHDWLSLGMGLVTLGLNVGGFFAGYALSQGRTAGNSLYISTPKTDP